MSEQIFEPTDSADPKFAVTSSGGDIQITCGTCDEPFFEMPEPVDFDLMIQKINEHCYEVDHG